MQRGVEAQSSDEEMLGRQLKRDRSLGVVYGRGRGRVRRFFFGGVAGARARTDSHPRKAHCMRLTVDTGPARRINSTAPGAK